MSDRHPTRGEKQFRAGELVPGTSYRVTGCIGTGGMGSVYEVEHVELGRRFVLKALLRELAARRDLVTRLRNEWRALGRLEHANIVTVTDAGISADGLPYYVMERLAGETLADRLRREGVLSVPDALEITLELLSGLGAAHQIGIVHRDIKPSNLFLSEGGPLKLLDFGIAKLEDENSKSITAKGIAIGTPRYMAPEQARGDNVDGRADLYAVGLILFEMIAGRGPFDHASSANALLLAQIHQKAPPLARLLPSIAGELSALVERLLAKDPRARPSSAPVAEAALRPLAERYRGMVSTSQVTREASYDLSKVSEESLAGTRPDGLAARKATQMGLGEAPAVAGPVAEDTRTERGMSWTLVETTAAPPAGNFGSSAGDTLTRPNYEHVDPQTLPEPDALGESTTSTMTSPALDASYLPLDPDDVPTHTSVPASDPGAHGPSRSSAPPSTPPPVERSRRSPMASASGRGARIAWGLFAVGTTACLVVLLLEWPSVWSRVAEGDPAGASEGQSPRALVERAAAAIPVPRAPAVVPVEPSEAAVETRGARRAESADAKPASRAEPAMRAAASQPEYEAETQTSAGNAPDEASKGSAKTEPVKRSVKAHSAPTSKSASATRINEVAEPWPSDPKEPEMPASGL